MTLEDLNARLFLLDAVAIPIPQKPDLLRVWKGMFILANIKKYGGSGAWAVFTLSEARNVIGAVRDANSERRNYIWL